MAVQWMLAAEHFTTEAQRTQRNAMIEHTISMPFLSDRWHTLRLRAYAFSTLHLS
jgi:hypothetical protein